MNEADHANPHTARIAEFVSAVRYEDIPGDVFVAQFSEDMVADPARGSEHRIANEQDVVDKFLKLAGESLSAARAEQLCERMLNLEKEADARQLAALLVAG